MGFFSKKGILTLAIIGAIGVGTSLTYKDAIGETTQTKQTNQTKHITQTFKVATSKKIITNHNLYSGENPKNYININNYLKTLTKVFFEIDSNGNLYYFKNESVETFWSFLINFKIDNSNNLNKHIGKHLIKFVTELIMKNDTEMNKLTNELEKSLNKNNIENGTKYLNELKIYLTKKGVRKGVIEMISKHFNLIIQEKINKIKSANLQNKIKKSNKTKKLAKDFIKLAKKNADLLRLKEQKRGAANYKQQLKDMNVDENLIKILINAYLDKNFDIDTFSKILKKGNLSISLWNVIIKNTPSWGDNDTKKLCITLPTQYEEVCQRVVSLDTSKKNKSLIMINIEKEITIIFKKLEHYSGVMKTIKLEELQNKDFVSLDKVLQDSNIPNGERNSILLTLKEIAKQIYLINQQERLN
jgi:hypothetical protein